MNLKSVIAAAAIVALPLAAQAALINGQLDIVGIANNSNSSFTPTGNLDFNPETGTAIIATGDLSGFLNSSFNLFDIDFSSPQTVYSGGGLTFTANSFHAFDNDASDGDRGFMASGVLTLAGFDDTQGVFAFSTQESMANQVIASFSSSTATVIPLPASVFLLLGALGGLGVVSRRRPTAA